MSGDRGGATLSPLFLTVAELPVLFAEAFKLFGNNLAAAAAGSASKGTSSAAHRADDTCSDMGYCTAALSGTGFALSVFWAGETLRFPLEVLCLECLFQLLKNTNRQLLATVWIAEWF